MPDMNTVRRPPSRSARWSEACAKARTALDDLRSALDDLDGVRQEYEAWRDNLPDSLRSSAAGEKLDAVADLTTSPDDLLGDAESAIDEAEGADLPMGFGRD